MSLIESIQNAIKTNQVAMGYKESIRLVKSQTPKMIVVAKNLPENRQKEIEHNAKLGNVKLEIFEGSSKELGIVCGKPFPVSVIAIK